MLDCVSHGLNFFVGEGLESAFDDFLAKGGIEESEVFQLQNGPLTLALSPSDGEREFFLRCLSGLLNGAFVVGLRGCEFGLMFVAPIEESWFGDVEMVSDASEAPALSTEVNELVYDFGRVHSLYFLGTSIGRGVGQRLSYRKSTE